MERATYTLDELTQKRLAQISERDQRSMSGELRFLINREWERIFNDSESAHAPAVECTPIVHEGALP